MALDTRFCLLHSPTAPFRLRQQAHSACHFYHIISVNIRVSRVAMRLDGNIGKYAGGGKLGSSWEMWWGRSNGAFFRCLVELDLTLQMEGLLHLSYL